MLEKRHLKWVYIAIPLVVAYVYLADLGFGALDNETDEARRALVAAEMIISGDYITPTLQGNLYLNKPPLYNWIIAGSFKLFNSYSTFALRFPVIVSIFIFGFIIYHFVKLYTKNFQVAYFSAIAFMTNGRILIYDSLQGLIDITFGWVMYLLFMLVYYFGEKGKYYKLFIFTYMLTAAGFMMKGLPAIACQGITLLTWAVYKKKIKKLFSLAHITGIFFFIILLGIYYAAFFRKNDIKPATLFLNLLHESSKRTILEQGIGNTILNLFTFPFEFLYHFAPWTILVVLVLHKGIRTILSQSDFLTYSILIFFTNIIIYWTSPQVYARYLFIVVPLLFNLLIYCYFSPHLINSIQRKIVDYFFIISTITIALACVAAPFIPQVQKINHLFLKSIIIALLLALCVYYMVRYPAKRLLSFVICLCVFRMGFNWLVVENRGHRYKELEATAQSIIDYSNNKELHILDSTAIGENLDGLTFHIITNRKKLLTFSKEIDYNAVYITDNETVRNKKYVTFMHFNNYGSSPLMLVKFVP